MNNFKKLTEDEIEMQLAEIETNTKATIQE